MVLPISSRERAGLLILVLGGGLGVALAPYLSGLIGGVVLYVVFRRPHAAVSRRLSPRTSAALMIAAALALLVIPALTFAGLLVDQAQTIAAGLLGSPMLARLSALKVGGYPVGPALVTLSQHLIEWVGANAFGLLGQAARIGLNLTIALFILYYLLLYADVAWREMGPYIPFSAASAELLRVRFHDVTVSTVIGTGLIAAIQGAVVGIGFTLTGLPNALFWGIVTVIFSILPVVGSGLVWGPGAVSLFLDGRYGAAIGLTVLGILVVGNVDVLIRPAVFRRFAQVHPLITLVGAIGGVGYFGLIGILIGPLALSYFFELIRIYHEEYLPKPLPIPAPVQAESGTAGS